MFSYALYIYVYVCQCFQNLTVLQSEYKHNQIHRTVWSVEQWVTTWNKNPLPGLWRRFGSVLDGLDMAKYGKMNSRMDWRQIKLLILQEEISMKSSGCYLKTLCSDLMVCHSYIFFDFSCLNIAQECMLIYPKQLGIKLTLATWSSAQLQNLPQSRKDYSWGAPHYHG